MANPLIIMAKSKLQRFCAHQQSTPAYALGNHCHPSLLTAICGLIVALLFWVVVSTPVKDAVQMGGDEGLELLKAMLVHRGFSLYSQIWSDQPPLYTYIISAIFALAGEQIFWARLFSTGCAAVLLCTLFITMTQIAGVLSGIIAVLICVSASPFLWLSVSVMQEMPMLAAASLAAFVYLRDQDKPGCISLRWGLSALLFAIALQIKLTAGLFVFSAIAASCISTLQCGLGFRQWLVKTVSFSGLLFILFGILSVTMGAFKPSVLIGTHFIQGYPNPEGVLPASYHFNLECLTTHWESFLGGTIGLIITLNGRAMRPLAAYASVLLIVQALLALVYRPWWPFYYVSLAIPLAMLTGVAVASLMCKTIALIQTPSPKMAFERLLWLEITTFFVIVLIFVTCTRIASIHVRIKQSPTVVESKALMRVLEHKAPVHWFFSQYPTYGFHAHLLVPPEIAVLSLKRFWSGQITTADIVTTLGRYKPEILVFRNDLFIPAYQVFADCFYTQVYVDASVTVFQRDMAIGSVLTNEAPFLTP